MQLINVLVARSVWLFRLAELNPRGVRLVPTVSQAIENRYTFQRQKRPEHPLQFHNGAYVADAAAVRVDLQIYDDGMVAETSASTDTSDAFLHDVLMWCAAQFGLNYHPSLVKKRLYYSEIMVHSRLSLTDLCPALRFFTGRLSQPAVMGGSEPQQVTGFSFGVDNQNFPSFSFERDLKSRFPENRYYSRAALETVAHLALLEEFEALFQLPAG